MTDIKKSIFMKDLNDILLSNLRTDVKDWYILSDLKDWHIKDWFIHNTKRKWILKTDTYFLTSTMDTLTIDLLSAFGKDGYIRLMYIRFDPRTDLTKVFPNI